MMLKIRAKWARSEEFYGSKELHGFSGLRSKSYMGSQIQKLHMGSWILFSKKCDNRYHSVVPETAPDLRRTGKWFLKQPFVVNTTLIY